MLHLPLAQRANSRRTEKPSLFRVQSPYKTDQRVCRKKHTTDSTKVCIAATKCRLRDENRKKRGLPSRLTCGKVTLSATGASTPTERGDPCRSSPASPIGRTQRVKKWFALFSTPIALSMTSSVARGRWRWEIQTPTRARGSRRLPRLIYTTSTSEESGESRTLLTGSFDAPYSHHFELGSRFAHARGPARLPSDRLLCRIEGACLRCDVR